MVIGELRALQRCGALQQVLLKTRLESNS